MNQYVTGAVIKELREKNHLTQAELAEKLNISDKTVSKWETAKGYPDISMLEPIANAFGISVAELLSGNAVNNVNVSANMMRSKFYVCPVCGNIVHSMGEAVIHCHGVQLLPCQAEETDKIQMVKLYPEGNAEARFQIRAVKKIFFYCNRDGLFSINMLKGIDDRPASYDESKERRELEVAAKMLFR